jgi:hypothetical protein
LLLQDGTDLCGPDIAASLGNTSAAITFTGTVATQQARLQDMCTPCFLKVLLAV